MNHYQYIIREKSNYNAVVADIDKKEVDLDTVIWIAVPDNIELVLADPDSQEHELMKTDYNTVVPGTDMIAVLRKTDLIVRPSKPDHSIDVLQYICHNKDCEHVWIEPVLPQYGECDDDCPICGTRHCSPERLTAHIS